MTVRTPAPLAAAVGLAAEAAGQLRKLPSLARRGAGAVRRAGRPRPGRADRAPGRAGPRGGPAGSVGAPLVGSRRPGRRRRCRRSARTEPVLIPDDVLDEVAQLTPGDELDHADLPLPDFDHQTVPQLRGRLRTLDLPELVQLRDYEQAHGRAAAGPHPPRQPHRQAHRGPAHRGPAHRGPAHRGPAHRGPAHRGPAHRGPTSIAEELVGGRQAAVDPQAAQPALPAGPLAQRPQRVPGAVPVAAGGRGQRDVQVADALRRLRGEQLPVAGLVRPLQPQQPAQLGDRVGPRRPPAGRPARPPRAPRRPGRRPTTSSAADCRPRRSPPASSPARSAGHQPGGQVAGRARRSRPPAWAPPTGTPACCPAR